jgi:hypothetical protein
MFQPNASSARRAWPLIAAGVMFVVVAGLAITQQDLVREVVVRPILQVGWVLSLMVGSLDQGCLWVGVLVAAVFFSLATRRQRRPVGEAPAAEPPRPTAVSRVRHWRTRIQADAGTPYVRDSRLADVRRLVIDVLAARQHISVEQMRQELVRGQYPLPAEVRAVLFPAEVRDAEPSWVARVWADVRQRILRLSGPPPGGADSGMALVARYLEDILEVEDDTHRR